MKIIGHGSRVVLALALLAVLGCEKEGPMERAGEQADEAIEELGEGVEQAADELREATGN